jgi:leucyl aminopeptidase
VREKCDLLLVLVTEATARGSDALSTLVAHAVKAGDFEVAAGKQLALYGLPAVSARRVVLLGAGSGSARDVRQAVAGAAASLKAAGVGKAVLCFGFEATGAAVAAAVLAAADACYSYTHTKPQAKPVALKKLVIGAGGTAGKNGMAASFKTAVAQAEGMALAREWANRPANHATPTMLADAARALARLPGISCKIHGPAEVAKLGMGAFMAVAQGSDQPLRFIELHYNGGAKGAAPVVLVGKGITFDTGGISLKPAPGMDDMTSDMAGAATVLGATVGAARLGLPLKVTTFLALAENMPGGGAQRPGDVVTMRNGTTVEVLNTDAEGRMVMADALVDAVATEPDLVMDVATLTGAAVVALGKRTAGVMGTETGRSAVLEASERSGEPFWPLPFPQELRADLTGRVADLRNIGERPGGALSAGIFLKEFVGETEWAHLDIAGPAFASGPLGYMGKGATGMSMRTVLQVLEDRAAGAQA